MKISDLKAGQGKVDIEVKVKSKDQPRVMQKYGKELKVGNAIVQDDSGEITLTLWNADVDNVNVGDSVRITNGYISEFNGKKQLTSGKYGKLEIVGAVASESSVIPAVSKEESPKPVKGKKAKKEEIEEVEF